MYWTFNQELGTSAVSVLDLGLGANQSLLRPCQPACLNDPFLSTRGTKYVMRHAVPDYRDVRQGMVIAVKLAFFGTDSGLSHMFLARGQKAYAT